MSLAERMCVCEMLDVSDEAITPRDAAEIADALLTSTSTLKELFMRGCGLGVVAAAALAPALNSSLTSISLCDNIIGDVGCAWLAYALVSSAAPDVTPSPLATLRLSGCGIGCEGVRRLSAALRHNRSLTTLWLSNNQCADHGTAALADALMHNDALTRLELDHNLVHDRGACSLAQALHVNRALQVVYLSNNRFADRGAKALANALECSTTLKEVAIGSNALLSVAGRAALQRALEVNATLLRLNVSHTFYLPARAIRQVARAEWLALGCQSVSMAMRDWLRRSPLYAVHSRFHKTLVGDHGWFRFQRLPLPCPRAHNADDIEQLACVRTAIEAIADDDDDASSCAVSPRVLSVLSTSSAASPAAVSRGEAMEAQDSDAVKTATVPTTKWHQVGLNEASPSRSRALPLVLPDAPPVNDEHDLAPMCSESDMDTLVAVCESPFVLNLSECMPRFAAAARPASPSALVASHVSSPPYSGNTAAVLASASVERVRQWFGKESPLLRAPDALLPSPPQPVRLRVDSAIDRSLARVCVSCTLDLFLREAPGGWFQAAMQFV